MSERNYWKLGCSWEIKEPQKRKLPSYYTILKQNKIAIGNENRFQINDAVAITEGHTIKAIGIVKSNGLLIQNANYCALLFPEYIPTSEKDWLYCFPVEWIDIENNTISYQLQQGWCKIQKNDLQKQIENKITEYQQNKMENKIGELLIANKNLILTGAPGVGKTYTTAEIAIVLCDKTFTDFTDRSKVMNRYKELIDSGQIAFTTFHQSLDYEEFVEGLKPEVTDDGQVTYEVKSGIFKQICKEAIKTQTTDNGSVDNFKESWNKLITDINEGRLTRVGTSNVDVSINTRNNIRFGAPVATFDTTYRLYTQDKNRPVYETYQQIVLRFLKEKYDLKDYQTSTIQQKTETKNFVLIIDEINRGNISKIFGELITLLEKDKRLGEENEIKVTLPYSQEKFGVPSNLYIIGTMNTADRSIGQIDYALRRRFAFYPLRADTNLITDQPSRDIFDKIKRLIEKRINPDLDADDIMIGHSYFMKDFENNLKYQIIPLLLEYNNDGLITLEEEERKILKQGTIPEIKQ